MTTTDTTTTESGNATTPPKFTTLLKVILDVMFYFSGFSVLVGIVMIALVGYSIPDDVSQRHTDIHYLFDFRVLPEPMSEPEKSTTGSISEIIQGQAEIKLNNTKGLKAWYIANTIVLLQGLAAILSLYFLRKLFANLAARAFFNEHNVKYITRVGQIIIVTCVLYPPAVYLGSLAILADIGEFNQQIVLAPPITLPVSGILFGISMLVLAQVIKEAAVIKQEQSLTI